MSFQLYRLYHITTVTSNNHSNRGLKQHHQLFLFTLAVHWTVVYLTSHTQLWCGWSYWTWGLWRDHLRMAYRDIELNQKCVSYWKNQLALPPFHFSSIHLFTYFCCCCYGQLFLCLHFCNLCILQWFLCLHVRKLCVLQTVLAYIFAGSCDPINVPWFRDICVFAVRFLSKANYLLNLKKKMNYIYLQKIKLIQKWPTVIHFKRI